MDHQAKTSKNTVQSANNNLFSVLADPTLYGPGGSQVASVQRKATGVSSQDTAQIQRTASAGVQGTGSKLPYLDRVQASFGKHDISHVQAYTNVQAKAASESIGAEAYATGTKVAFANSNPSLHTVAHEAAHIVQQQAGVQLKGGVGQAGDHYERQADAVADTVVQNKSAEALLDTTSKSSASSNTVSRNMPQNNTQLCNVQRVLKVGEHTYKEEPFELTKQLVAKPRTSVLGDKDLGNLEESLKNNNLNSGSGGHNARKRIFAVLINKWAKDSSSIDFSSWDELFEELEDSFSSNIQAGAQIIPDSKDPNKIGTLIIGGRGKSPFTKGMGNHTSAWLLIDQALKTQLEGETYDDALRIFEDMINRANKLPGRNMLNDDVTEHGKKVEEFEGNIEKLTNSKAKAKTIQSEQGKLAKLKEAGESTVSRQKVIDKFYGKLTRLIDEAKNTDDSIRKLSLFQQAIVAFLDFRNAIPLTTINDSEGKGRGEPKHKRILAEYENSSDKDYSEAELAHSIWYGLLDPKPVAAVIGKDDDYRLKNIAPGLTPDSNKEAILQNVVHQHLLTLTEVFPKTIHKFLISHSSISDSFKVTLDLPDTMIKNAEDKVKELEAYIPKLQRKYTKLINLKGKLKELRNKTLLPDDMSDEDTVADEDTTSDELKNLYIQLTNLDENLIIADDKMSDEDPSLDISDLIEKLNARLVDIQTEIENKQAEKSKQPKIIEDWTAIKVNYNNYSKPIYKLLKGLDLSESHQELLKHTESMQLSGHKVLSSTSSDPDDESESNEIMHKKTKQTVGIIFSKDLKIQTIKIFRDDHSGFSGSKGAHSTANIVHIDEFSRPLIGKGIDEAAKELIKIIDEKLNAPIPKFFQEKLTKPASFTPGTIFSAKQFDAVRYNYMTEAEERLKAAKEDLSAADGINKATTLQVALNALLVWFNYTPYATIAHDNMSGNGEPAARRVVLEAQLDKNLFTDSARYSKLLESIWILFDSKAVSTQASEEKHYPNEIIAKLIAQHIQAIETAYPNAAEASQFKAKNILKTQLQLSFGNLVGFEKIFEELEKEITLNDDFAAPFDKNKSKKKSKTHDDDAFMPDSENSDGEEYEDKKSSGSKRKRKRSERGRKTKKYKYDTDSDGEY